MAYTTAISAYNMDSLFIHSQLCFHRFFSHKDLNSYENDSLSIETRQTLKCPQA